MKVLFISSGNKTGNGLPIIINQAESLRQAGVDVDHFTVIGRGLWGYLRNISVLRKHIQTFQPNVIHAHYAFNGYLANLASARPLVVSLMGSDIWTHKYYPFVVRTFRRLFQWKVTITKSIEMRERVGVPEAIIVPNGVDMEKFHSMDKTTCQQQLGWNTSHRHVLFPANPATGRKNWPLAEAAIALLNQNADKSIELHPMVNVPNNETPIWYNAADVVLLPSFYEGSANAVKEAMACARPMVTTDMGDCRERLDGVRGCYVAKTFEVTEVAELINKSLHYDSATTDGRERLLEDGLSSKQVAEQLIVIYQLCK